MNAQDAVKRANRHIGLMLSTARRFSASGYFPEDLIDDVVSEMWIKTRSIAEEDRFNPLYKDSTYLSHVYRGLCLNFSKSHRKTTGQKLGEDLPAPALGKDDLRIKREVVDKILRVSNLRERSIVMFLLRGKSVQWISENAFKEPITRTRVYQIIQGIRDKITETENTNPKESLDTREAAVTSGKEFSKSRVESIKRLKRLIREKGKRV